MKPAIAVLVLCAAPAFAQENLQVATSPATCEPPTAPARLEFEAPVEPALPPCAGKNGKPDRCSKAQVDAYNAKIDAYNNAMGVLNDRMSAYNSDMNDYAAAANRYVLCEINRMNAAIK